MNPAKTQGFFQSRTILYSIAALLAYAAKELGLPLLPPDVSAELVSAVAMALTLFVPTAMARAMWFRLKARAIIDRVF